MRSRDFSCSLILIAIPAFVACSFSHMCMCGHLAHPPYALWQVGIDVIWIGCFSAAAIGLLNEADRSAWCCVPIAFLLVSRLYFEGGPMGLLAFLVDLPVAGALTISVVWMLYRSLKRPLSARQ